MVKKLQTRGFFAVHCIRNEQGFLCGVVFVSESINQSKVNVLDPDTGTRFALCIPSHGYYLNLQLNFAS